MKGNKNVHVHNQLVKCIMETPEKGLNNGTPVKKEKFAFYHERGTLSDIIHLSMLGGTTNKKRWG